MNKISKISLISITFLGTVPMTCYSMQELEFSSSQFNRTRSINEYNQAYMGNINIDNIEYARFRGKFIEAAHQLSLPVTGLLKTADYEKLKSVQVLYEGDYNLHYSLDNSKNEFKGTCRVYLSPPKVAHAIGPMTGSAEEIRKKIQEIQQQGYVEMILKKS